MPCGVVNYDQWKCSPFIGYFVDDLRLHRHDWPENPTVRKDGRVREGDRHRERERESSYINKESVGVKERDCFIIICIVCRLE